MPTLGGRSKIWWLMAAVAVAAVACAAGREHGGLAAGAVVVFACVIALASRRYADLMGLRKAQGLATHRALKARIALNAMVVAVLVIGLSDLAFLAGYFGYMRLFPPISSHWTQYDDPRWMAMSAAAGTALAVRVAVGLRRRLSPLQSVASKRATWRSELGRGLTLVVISRAILEFLD
jgi:hypothetical protein